jgi:hypothetical protein
MCYSGVPEQSRVSRLRLRQLELTCLMCETMVTSVVADMSKQKHTVPREEYACCSLGEVMDNLTGEVIGLGHYTVLSLSKCPCNRAYQDDSCVVHASNKLRIYWLAMSL